MKRPANIVLIAASIASCAAPAVVQVPPLTVAVWSGERSKASPMTRKVDLVETLHGTRVADPYRWLEEAESPAVRAWTGEQNARTRKRLDTLGGREALHGQIANLLQVGYVSAPSIRTTKAGTRRFFHSKREGAQNQPTLYVRDGVRGSDRVLLDASSLSEDGTTALDWWYPSRDGGLLAWGRSESGSEESTLLLRDVVTGKELSDKIPHTRHATVAWMPDGKSFYYSRYPEAGTVPPGDEKYFSKIYHHVIGRDPGADPVVFGDHRDKTDTPGVMVTEDGRWLVVRVHMGWDKSEVWIKDLAKSDPRASSGWVAVAKDAHALFEPIARSGRLYLQTNDGAARYKLYAVAYEKPERAAWKEILAEGPDVLDDVAILKNEIVATYLHEASSRIERFGLDGKSRGAVALPGIGSAGVTGAFDGEELFVSFSSYVVPSQVHRVDLASKGASKPPVEAWDQVGAAWKAADIEVERAYAMSKDGTRVPMFIIAKKGLPRTGDNPVILHGYGGFNVNQTPVFSPRALASVQRGVVWVTAILRGGGELGEEWHRAGMLERKQNVFDDFIACAETLVAEKITRPDRLGILGGSNGGLLVAAAITQRPDLFRAGLSLVPLTDMVRYHRFRIARLWMSEYGDPDKAEDFRFLYAYSPYHHVREGARYPAMLFTTAESDSRVDPMHARKMAARLQEVQTDPSRPILLRVETKAGHGAGKPVSKLADELTDELSFMLDQLGVPSGH